MIDYDKLIRCKVVYAPFPWVFIENLIPLEYQDKLFYCYPTNSFEQQRKSQNEEKNYSFSICNAIINNDVTVAYSQIHNVWHEFFAHLTSDQYLDRLGDILHMNLSGARYSIAFYRFTKNDFVSPHIDKKHKILTQLFYFNPIWGARWGGELKLLWSNNQEDCILVIPPHFSYSVILPRTENAWHMVSDIKDTAQSDRLSLQFEIWE